MRGRGAEIVQFLRANGFGASSRIPLAGDASARRYERLDGKSKAILMDAPPGPEGETERFVEMTAFLKEIGLKVPDILAADAERGLLVIEDFGDALVARVLHNHPDLEPRIMDAAADVLIKLNGANLYDGPWLETYDTDFALSEAMLAFQWYLPAIRPGIGESMAEDAQEALRPFLRDATTSDNLVLRDFHAENMFWLPRQTGTDRLGLIDYQGARFGSPVYDLISLTTDARRDVRHATAAQVQERFRRGVGMSADHASTLAAIWSMQRNLKILGLFVRASIRDGKSGYLALLPRVWQHVMDAIAHPSLKDLRPIVGVLPPPNRASVMRIMDAV